MHTQHAWYISFGLVGAIAAGALCSSATTGCTVTSSSGDGGTVFMDDGGPAITNDGATTDTGTVVADAGAGGDGGGGCMLSGFGTAACDDCVSANCCPEITTCDTEGDAGRDDAGHTTCGQNLGCILVNVNPPPDSGQPPFSVPAAIQACGSAAAEAALANCAASHCGTECMLTPDGG
jgi:hypothetical protein